jgi:hypothetical protein
VALDERAGEIRVIDDHDAGGADEGWIEELLSRRYEGSTLLELEPVEAGRTMRTAWFVHRAAADLRDVVAGSTQRLGHVEPRAVLGVATPHHAVPVGRRAPQPAV